MANNRSTSDRSRQSEIFARLFTDSRDALRRYIHRLVRSEETAEDIVQEAFLRTYEQGSAVRTPRAFLFATARNLATDYHRHDRKAATDLVGDLDDLRVVGTGGPVEDVLIADEASRILKQAIDRLTPQCNAALTLKLFHGYSYKEIGATLGLSAKTVEKHIARGLERTHEYLLARYSNYRPERDKSRPAQ